MTSYCKTTALGFGSVTANRFAVLLQLICSVTATALQCYCNTFAVTLQKVCSKFAVRVLISNVRLN